MATMKHRKLFPAENETTQTDCSEFCDPPCSYNCYPFTDFYYPSPPPPSPPLSAVDHNDQSQNISPFIIILLSLVATSLLAVGYYIVIAKSCAGFHRRSNSEPEPSRSDAIDEDFVDENHVDHPIWFITTVGLQQSIINAITVIKYKKGEGLIEGTECSVCLNEFQEDETLRLLPKCNHAFHIPCIDTWLRSHTNCPLCRAIIVTDSLTSNSNMARPSPLASSDQNGEALVTNEDTQMGINSENDIQMGQNRIRAATENEADQILQIGDDDHGALSKEGINCQENCVPDSASEIQPVRRSSVSMDYYHSSSPETMVYGPEDFYSGECEENSIAQLENDESYNLEVVRNKDDEDGNSDSDTIRLIRRPSKAQCLRLSPVSMKRSFSCGGRLLPPKHHRSFNSVLPL